MRASVKGLGKDDSDQALFRAARLSVTGSQFHQAVPWNPGTIDEIEPIAVTQALSSHRQGNEPASRRLCDMTGEMTMPGDPEPAPATTKPGMRSGGWLSRQPNMSLGETKWVHLTIDRTASWLPFSDA
jgi:hypothetical protein